MRSCNSLTPEEYLVCTKRHWVTIKVLYRYLWECLLSWHGSRLGFVTPHHREVSQGPLGIQDPMSNTLVTLLASSLWWCITEWALRYISVIRSNKSQPWSMPTQQTPSEIPVEHLYSYPVMLQCLIHTRYSSGVSELHDLMVIGTYTWHVENDSNKRDTMICYVYSLGLVHHIVLLMMWSRYQMTTHVYD